MNVYSAMIQNIVQHGVGKRPPQDEYFQNDSILSDMTKRLSVFEIDVGKLADDYEPFKCHVPGCYAEFESLMDFESHYNAGHKYSCCECKKKLPSSHFLDLHVAEAHDSFFAELAKRKPAYQCYVETCSVKSSNPEERMQHCIKEHKFPPNFRFDSKIHKMKVKNMNKKIDEAPECISMESDDSILSNTALEISEKKNVKPKQFNFHPSRPKSFQQNKNFTASKSKQVKNNTRSVLDDDKMLLELSENLPES